MKDGFDLLVRQSLRQGVEHLQPSEDMLLNIRREADRRKKEKNDMTFKMKKLVAIAAALCLITVTCYAAVEIGSYEMHSSKDIFKFEDMPQAEKEVGFEFKCVEAFSNGFKFENGGTSVSTALDGNGDPMGEETKGINLGYINSENDRVMLLVEPKSRYENTEQDVEVGYNSDTYKFVPPDYQLTDEDKRMMEEGDFFVSYGSGEVEINEVENYRWEDGGLVYSLVASDCGFGEDELAAMAQEIRG